MYNSKMIAAAYKAAKDKKNDGRPTKDGRPMTDKELDAFSIDMENEYVRCDWCGMLTKGFPCEDCGFQ